MSSSPLLTKLAKKNHRLRDLESQVRCSEAATLPHFPASSSSGASSRPLGPPFLPTTPPKPHIEDDGQNKMGKQDDDDEDLIDEEPAQKPVNFPPRKRSIPYGFDFDLDEVWAPLNPHLRGALRKSSSVSCSSSNSSDCSIRGMMPQATPVFSVEDSSRVSTARLALRGRPQQQQEDAEEFAVENEDIFMQINNLNLSEDKAEDPKEAAADATIITNVGLPSARTLRGGASIVARGRHEVPKSAMSNYSNYSSSSSRFGSSPTPSRKTMNNGGGNTVASSSPGGLTPGLKSKLHSPRKTNKL